MYYLRSRPAAEPIKFTLDVESLLKNAGNIQIKVAENTKKEEGTDNNPELLGENPIKKIKVDDSEN